MKLTIVCSVFHVDIGKPIVQILNTKIEHIIRCIGSVAMHLVIAKLVWLQYNLRKKLCLCKLRFHGIFRMKFTVYEISV